jgi:pantothenate kinase
MQQYDQFATEIRKRVAMLKSDEQLWIGLAGSPGSGKSTLANALLERLSDIMTVIPMDGYHYPLSYLDKMRDPKKAHARRGAPFTFNAEQFVNDLIEARITGQGFFPSFDSPAPLFQRWISLMCP